MTNAVTNVVLELAPHFEGYVYPNEATQQPLWSVLIVLYPYITGLVAGAFIMASLVRVFNVKALQPVYRCRCSRRSRSCCARRCRCSSTWGIRSAATR